MWHKVNLKKLVDSSPKKFVLTCTCLAFSLSLNDYAVAVMKVPDLERLNYAEGAIKPHISRRGPDMIGLMVKGQLRPVLFSCGINELDERDCISHDDPRFFEFYYKSNGERKRKIVRGKNGKFWWYEANIFGPFKQKRLMQLVVDDEIVFDYATSKHYYLNEKSNYLYINTWALIICFSVFCFFQLSEPHESLDEP